MKSGIYAINNFFQLEEINQETLLQLEKNENFNKIKEKMRERLKSVPLPDSFFEQMFKQVNSLLNFDIRKIFLKAWINSKTFYQHLNSFSANSNEPIFVPLVNHSIKSEHVPFIEPHLNELSLGKIQFKINLDLKLEGIVLKIEEQKIKEINIGSCKGDCVVQYEEIVLLDKKNLELSFKESISLGEGIPLNLKNFAQDKINQFLDLPELKENRSTVVN